MRFARPFVPTIRRGKLEAYVRPNRLLEFGKALPKRTVNKINRRTFLRNSLATTALLTVARSNAFSADFNTERHFAPVKVARDRIIREVVGLRPYRDEGFVVDAERVGGKLLIHNYGHGGAGITLSWGTASLALDLARDFLGVQVSRAQRSRRAGTPRHFAVLGCGVSGLSTARLLQRHFQDGGFHHAGLAAN